jgi:hypothetical protein
MSLAEMVKGFKKGDEVIVDYSDDTYEGILTKKQKFQITIKYNCKNGFYYDDIITMDERFIKSINKLPNNHITQYKLCKVCNNVINIRAEDATPRNCGKC